MFVMGVLSLVIALTQESGQTSNPKGPTCKLPKLREELLRRMDVDQEARKAMVELMSKQGSFDKSAAKKLPELEKVMEVDKGNTERMRSIIREHGWPGKTLVGEDGAHAAWILVQHADLHRAFQKECLELMLKMPAGEVSPKDVAYLTDRVLVGEGKPQRYGTQLDMKDGKLTPKAIEDSENVDSRRKEMGLGPLKEYLEFASEQLGPKKKS